MTREEVAEIMTYCQEYTVSYKDRLVELMVFSTAIRALRWFNYCVVSVPVIVTNNSLMWQRSLFLKIVQVVII